MNAQPRRRFLLLLAVWVSAVLPLLAVPTARAFGLPREAGAIYLEDFFSQPYRLKVLEEGPIFFNADQARFLGSLRRGQLVELQAVSQDGSLVRVRGQARQGQVAGWINASFLSPLDPAFVDGLRRSVARQRRVQALIAASDIALGMTPAEVAASLGPPPKKSSRVDAQGTSERWEYVRYEQVPRSVTGVDPYGRLLSSLVYERVPVGKFTVVFNDTVVSAIEQSEGTLANAAQVQIVPPPINLRF